MLIDLAIAPISQTLYRLAAQRRSGDLLVRSGATVKMVFFDHGRVVFAGSNLKRERLGEDLVALGRITDADFDRVSGMMRGDHKLRFGDALAAAGVMDRDAVGTSVASLVARIVLSLFRLPTGAASFDERDCAIPLDYMVSLSIHRLLLKGISLMSKPELILTGIGSLDRSVRLAAMPPFSFAIRRCTAEQKEVLESAQAPVTLRRLASTSQGLSPKRLRAAYALLASGILQDATANAATPIGRPGVQTEHGGFLLSPLQRTPEITSSPAVSDEVPPPSVTREVETVTTTAPAAFAAPPPPAEPAPAQPAAVEAAPPPAPAPHNAMEVERLFAQANVFLMIEDLAGAIQTYAKLVQLEPNVGVHRARLAALMARSPRTAREAERQFIEAVRLDPDNVDLHYELALYYRTMKVPSRAIAEFRTVLQLDPRHKEARAQLVAASPNDSVLKTLKKLLR